MPLVSSYTPGKHHKAKMVKYTLKILQHMLQDFYSVSVNLVFSCFQGLEKETSRMKWVKIFWLQACLSLLPVSLLFTNIKMKLLGSYAIFVYPGEHFSISEKPIL